MKLMDEKGRLFGKLNIIDVMIVTVIIGAMLGICWKLGLVKNVGTENLSGKKPIVKLWVKKVSKYTTDAIISSKGENLEDVKTNEVIGKIIGVDVKPAQETAADSTGKWVLSDVPNQNDVYITMEATSPSVNGNVKLSSKDAKIGVEAIVKGTKFQATSYVIGVE